MRHRLLALTALICLMPGVTFGSAGLLAVPAQAYMNQQESQTFPETGKTVKGRFLQYWQQNGGLPQQGYPISEEMQEQSKTDGKTYTVQYFERAVFEMHPENQPPHDVLLSLLGTFEYKGKYGSEGAPDQRASTQNPLLFEQTGKTLGGKFRAYWESHGGLPQQGYPISEEFQEVSPLDGKSYPVQYFERVVFELHPENAGTEYEVLLSQLGKFQYDRRYTAAIAPTATVPIVPASTVPTDATNWIREHAIPLSSAMPSDDYTDLMPLKQVVGDARIVAVGEASHGGSEFFTMKHRLLRFLVREMGFTVFAIEDGWAETEGVNAYIQGGPGTAEQAVRSLPIVFWRTREVIEMVEWMRVYNQGRSDAPALSFQGVDMQTPVKAMQNVLEYLQTVDSTAAERAKSLYKCYDDFRNYASLPQEVKSQCRAALRQVHDELTANREAYENVSSPQEFTRAQFSARIILQNEELQSEVTTRAILRDRYMAENASWLLEQGGPDARMFVWAHNGHIGAVSSGERGEYRSMGAHLKQLHGDAAMLIGFDFYKGSFNARPPAPPRNMRVFMIEASTEGSYANYFHSADIPLFALDVRNTSPGSAATDWLFAHRKMWWIGSIFNPIDPTTGARELLITDTFDVVIFIDTITPSNLLPD